VGVLTRCSTPTAAASCSRFLEQDQAFATADALISNRPAAI